VHTALLFAVVKINIQMYIFILIFTQTLSQLQLRAELWIPCSNITTKYWALNSAIRLTITDVLIYLFWVRLECP